MHIQSKYYEFNRNIKTCCDEKLDVGRSIHGVVDSSTCTIWNLLHVGAFP